MAYRPEAEKVAKLTRAIIDGTAKRYKNSTLGDIYGSKPELAEDYQKWHYNILTDFAPGKEMQEMVDTLLLLFMKDVNLNECNAWLLYYGHMTTLFAMKVSGLTNISKVAFMEQEKREEKIGSAEDWRF